MTWLSLHSKHAMGQKASSQLTQAADSKVHGADDAIALKLPNVKVVHPQDAVNLQGRTRGSRFVRCCKGCARTPASGEEKFSMTRYK